MYLCMYVWRLPFMECPWNWASNWALRRGPSKVGPMFQPRGTIDTASCTLIRTKACVRFLNQLYSRKLRVTCTLIFRVRNCSLLMGLTMRSQFTFSYPEQSWHLRKTTGIFCTLSVSLGKWSS